MTATGSFVWCTYRSWSFRILEGLLDLAGWRCALIVTTRDCIHDFSGFEAAGIPILRIQPRTELKRGGQGFAAIARLSPAVVFHYGWSWMVPEELCALCPNVTLHPGRLPQGRGGSPIQNQIRQGWDWTYANIIALGPGLDEGPIFARERLSLEGEEADAVWARVVATGALLTRRFLADLAAGRAKAVAQENSEPRAFKRVKPADARLDPASQTARFVSDVIRAHNETDANSYVRLAYLPVGPRDFVIERASLSEPSCATVDWTELAAGDETPFEICHRVNNDELAVRIQAADGRHVFATRGYLRAAIART